jgi:2-oxoglutarate ferredoxin oxidoreductase subunit alpha
MSDSVLMTGTEAMAEAAIRAGCRFYFGYPITPQNELTAYMSEHMVEAGGTFIQSESELAAINMVYGASAAGARAMTSSSSPGISLKQEGISYIAGSELPAVIINVQRGGPGLGDISPSQADYFQAVKGGGHGDYHSIVLAPYSVQEAADLVMKAFYLADKYRMPAIILADGQIGQMMEPVTFSEIRFEELPPKEWALTGAKNGRERNIVKSFFPVKGDLEEFNKRLQARYETVRENEVLFEEVNTDGADVVLVAYGTSARIAKAVVANQENLGANVGLLRPITLWPFPSKRLRALATSVKAFLTVEMSAGQMVEDVRLSVEGARPVEFFGRMGGGVPEEDEIRAEIKRIASEVLDWKEAAASAKGKTEK